MRSQEDIMPEDILGLADALRAGALTAEALLDRCLARIAARDGVLNSFVALDGAGARTAGSILEHATPQRGRRSR